MKISIASMTKLTLLISLLTFSNCVLPQSGKNISQERVPFKDRISIGGALGLGFGSNSILVDISPIIGYSVTNNFVVGLGLTYKYYQLNDYYLNMDNGS